MHKRPDDTAACVPVAHKLNQDDTTATEGLKRGAKENVLLDVCHPAGSRTSGLRQVDELRQIVDREWVDVEVQPG